MNFAEMQIFHNLGWTLLHSLWQIALVAACLWIVLSFTVRASANLRYLLACFALCLALVLPCLTYIWLTDSAAKEQAQISNLKSQISNLKFQISEEEKQSVLLNGVAKKVEASKSETPLWSLKLETWNLELILPFLVWIWLFGVSIFALRTVGGLWQLRVLHYMNTKPVDNEWKQRFFSLREKIGISKAAQILESTTVAAPIVMGWLKPVVLVPASAFAGLAPAQLEAILAHELIHIRRHDFLINLIQTAVEILLFYHPCVWWISHTIRNEREFACDDAVVKLYGERLNYAHALANLETLRYMARNRPPQLSPAANGGKLMNRIQRILQKETEIKRANSLWSAGLACALISAFLLITFSAGNNIPVNAESKAKSKKLAVGFVSIPPVDRSDNPPHDSQATTQILIEKLKAHKIPAIGFVQGSMISDGEKLYPVRAEMVRAWRDAGFEVGIGGFKHIWFYDTPFESYVANTEKNEAIAKRILAEKNLPLRYFSYPFLNTGKTVEDTQRFENWLNQRGLRSVKYSFDNQEWMYSYAYDMARKDNDLNTMKELRAEFLAYMEKMLTHYEAYSQEMFERDIAQTMVLTSSRLVADTSDGLFGMFEKRGYTFVSIDEAQSDEAYQTPDNFAGVKAGISWFERWTMAKGGKLREEPEVSAFVEEVWNARKSK